MKARTTQALMVAGAMALAGAAVGQEQARRNPGAGPNALQTERQRIEADTSPVKVSAADQTAIYKTMAQVANDATTTGKFDDLIKQFTSGPNPTTPATQPTTRNTIGEPTNPAALEASPGGPGAESAATGAAALSRADFDSQIAQFQRDWKEKYHSDFAIDPKSNEVFSDGFAQINTSDLGEIARTAAARIGPVRGDSEPSPRVPADQLNPNAVQPSGAYGGNGETGLDSRAIVLVEPNSGAPMATLAMVKGEGGQWKFDTPQGVDRQRLRSNLARHLQMIERDKANWPGDRNEASRMVAHHIFQAIDDAGAGLMQGGSVVQEGTTLPTYQTPARMERKR